MFVAKNHPNLQVTGLSSESGGWIARRPFLYKDPVYPGAFPEVQERVRRKLEDMLDAGRIHLETLPTQLQRPHRCEIGPLPANRVKGILLGVAIGDALGNTSESMRSSDRWASYGEIRDYLPNPHAQGARIGLPSDDTQLTVWTLESLLEIGEPDLDELASSYRQHRIFGIGRTMRSFFTALDQQQGNGEAWDARQHSAGNGALMRVPGAFLPHAWTVDAGTLDTVALSSALTHDHASSTAACVAFARMLAEILWSGPSVPSGYFWETFVETARPLEGSQRLPSRVPGDDYCGPIWKLVEDRVPQALQSGASVAQACNGWYSGAFLLETVPSVLFLLERYRDDPEEAMIRAVMDTWDNDTVAAIVGSIMGAMHGEDAFPVRWRKNLTGRTTADDDGRVDEAFAQLRRYGGNGLRD